MEFITSVLQFIASWNDNQVTVVFLGCMSAFFLWGWLFTGSYSIGVMLFEVPNCLNLSIYATQWLIPGNKPFMPLWISMFLLILPFILLFVLFLHRLTKTTE